MVRIGAMLGLGLAYAGSRREDVRDLLTPFVSDTSATADMEVVAIGALALGIVYSGTCRAVVSLTPAKPCPDTTHMVTPAPPRTRRMLTPRRPSTARGHSCVFD